MKRIGNIYEKIIDLNNIELAIAKASIGKGHRKSVEKILDSSTYYALQVQQLLKEKKYNPSPYIEMKIRDGANRKERTIFKPHFYPDQVIHWALILQIESSLAKMDRSLLDAANDLGANRWQRFCKVTLPLSLPGVVSGITLVFLPAVSSFVIPKLLGGGGYMLIGNVIENQFITVGEWNFGSAISMVMAVIIMISMVVTRKLDKSDEGLTRKRGKV